MEATDIRLNLVNRDSAVKAIGSFSLDQAFAIRCVRVMEGKDGKNFVAFPSKEKGNGEYEDLAFPLSKDLYHKISDAIVAEYQRVKEQAETKNAENVQEEAQTKTEAEAIPAPKKGKSR